MDKDKAGASIGLFLRAIKEAYPKDKCQPGLVLSYLGDRRLYYASVLRYEDAYGYKKIVISSATGITIGEALKSVAEIWTNEGKNLKEFVAQVGEGRAF